MKLIITESQHKFLLEQSDYLMDKRGNAILNATGIRSDKDYKSIDKSIDKAREGKPIDPHTLMTILQIGTVFIPVVGPFISAGIGLADAAMYYKEGDKKTAGLIGLFSVIPGIGGLASKMGLTKWSAKALGQIGKKISLGQKLSPVEIQVANKVAQNNKLIQSEVQKLSKTAIAKNVTKKGAKFVGTKVAPYVAADVAYNKTYDKFIQDSRDLVDFTKINVNKISDANKQAALNTKF
jgi:hypothetical protein